MMGKVTTEEKCSFLKKNEVVLAAIINTEKGSARETKIHRYKVKNLIKKFLSESKIVDELESKLLYFSKIGPKLKKAKKQKLETKTELQQIVDDYTVPKNAKVTTLPQSNGLVSHEAQAA